MRLPQKDSATWKGIITSLQAFVAFLAVLLPNTEFQRLVMEFYPGALPAVSFAAGLIALVIGLLRKDVENY